MKTHEDFKSVDASIASAEDMAEQVGHALCYQYMFDRRTSPWEMEEFEDDDLQHFEVILEKVDRLYYINQLDDGVSNREYEILARMDHGRKKAYVSVIACCDFTGFDCQGGGYIFVSFNVNVFSKIMLERQHDHQAIYRSLAEDGLSVQEQSEYDRAPACRWESVPMLKYLCHVEISDSKNNLARVYKDYLPKMLIESVDEFIKLRETREAFDMD